MLAEKRLVAHTEPVIDRDRADPFASAFEQAQAELRWLSLRLRIVVDRGRGRRAIGPPEEYRGLYVADEEVDLLLSPEAPPSLAGPETVARAEELRRDLDARAAATTRSGRSLPLDRLAAAFGLGAAERQALIIGLAPHVDAGYDKVFAYANDDVTKKRPTVGLALDVLADAAEDGLRLRPLFYTDAPLMRHALMSVAEDAGQGSSPLISRFLELDPHVAEVLLGFDGLDPRLHDVVRRALTAGDDRGDGLALARVLGRRGASRAYFGGRWAEEKRRVIGAGCCQAEYGLLLVDSKALHRADAPASLVRLVCRDAVLLGAAICFEGWDAQGEDEAALRSLGSLLQPCLSDHPLPVFFCGRPETGEHLPVAPQLRIVLPEPSHAERVANWDAAGVSAATGSDAALLASAYRLGAAEIVSASLMAQSLADWHGADAASLDEFKLAARLQSQPRLTALAQKIEPRFGWGDIVLPEDRLTQLRELTAQVLLAHVVYDEWGFGSKLSLGRGVAALFAGQSGTGKTMAAEIIAHELGLDLYKIDLSGLVSKYIGETEKNLARVFDEAGDSGAILFFDEADAVFGKRTEVRDSHDRYANIEVSYLLQKIEEYDGIVVMASNLRTNIDEAFLRRMRAVVEFPFPEEEDRLRIWQRMLSGAAPVAGDVDLAFMARQFRIAGGNIKNVALLAAFLAATDGDAIGMSHLIRATKREYQKLGRLVTQSDFGAWYGEVGV
jgi:hypothetical protein